MAMLAEPRQRKRYNLMPKGKALYEDENRFGTKMLERMGWKKGQGLGAKEDGSKDFVRIRFKNDAMGLGFEERDDQWTQHEQSFDGLLKNLNNEDDSIACKKNDKATESENEMPVRVGFGFQGTSKKYETKVGKMKEKISGVSLEERSKQSKARVHYKKFTKGKDLAQYSEKDLANIFGKKAVDEQQNAANDIHQYLSNAFGKSEELSSGVQIINTGVSVNDYFKTKIESRNAADDDLDVTKNGIGINSSSNEVQFEKNNQKRDSTNSNEDTEEKGKKETQIFYSNLSVNDYFKNKMDALKRGKKYNLSADKNLSTEMTEETVMKKKKKSKIEIKELEDDCLPDPEVKKSKKKKHISPQGSESDGIEKEAQVLKKRKKSKKCKLGEVEEFALDDCVKIKSNDHVSKTQKRESRAEETVNLTLEKANKKSKKINCDDQEKYESSEIKGDDTKKCDVVDKAGETELHLDDCTGTKSVAESIKKVKKSMKTKNIKKDCAEQENCERSEIRDSKKTPNTICDVEEVSETIKKVKKSKKIKDCDELENCESSEITDDHTKKQQNKSNICDVEEIAEFHLHVCGENKNEAESIKKVKKSKKIKDFDELENCESSEITNDHTKKTQNKSKIYAVEEIADLELHDFAENKNESESIKKVKKSKKCQLKEETEPSRGNSLFPYVEKKSKKIKLIQKQEEIDEIETNTLEIVNNEENSKKCVSDKRSEFSFEMKKKRDKSRNEMQIDLENNISTAVKRKSENFQEETKESIGAIEPFNEIDLTQEPAKKKKKNNKSKENSEIVNLDDSCNEEIAHNTKNQVIEVLTTTASTGENVLNISKPVAQNSDQPSIKPKKRKRKQVSSTAKNAFITDVNFQALDLEEIKNQYQAFNIYPISSFCAEKFRNINLNIFTGSILPQLEGYGLSSDLQLDIKYIKNDEERITNLWKCVLNKYVQLENSKKTYKQYLSEAYQARKKRMKLPRLNVKTLKRKNVFQVL